MSNEDTHRAMEQRLEYLENEVKSLKESKTSSTKSRKSKTDTDGKEKKPREKTAYNIYVSEYINSQKQVLGEKFNHKIAFSEAARTWTSNKKLATATA